MLKRCIIFGFYIKPQHVEATGSGVMVVSYLDSTSNHNAQVCAANSLMVVSYLDSTSNHNIMKELCRLLWLYHIWILHQTTTTPAAHTHGMSLYHIWILHQTTTLDQDDRPPYSCIIFGFYIKPQRHARTHARAERCIIFGFYIKPQRRAGIDLTNRSLSGLHVMKNAI